MGKGIDLKGILFFATGIRRKTKYERSGLDATYTQSAGSVKKNTKKQGCKGKMNEWVVLDGCKKIKK